MSKRIKYTGVPLFGSGLGRPAVGSVFSNLQRTEPTRTMPEQPKRECPREKGHSWAIALGAG